MEEEQIEVEETRKEVEDLFAELTSGQQARRLKCPLCSTAFKFNRYNRFRNFFLMHNSKVKLSLEMNRLLETALKNTSSSFNLGLETLTKNLKEVWKKLEMESPYKVTKDIEACYLNVAFPLPEYQYNDWKLPAILSEAIINISMMRLGNKYKIGNYWNSSNNLSKGFTWAVDSKRNLTAFDVLFHHIKLNLSFVQYIRDLYSKDISQVFKREKIADIFIRIPNE